jgi:5-formyltetrahydrofolate cyclo-ligase
MTVPAPDKDAVRAAISAARRAMSDAARAAARAAVRDHVLDRFREQRWGCVAAYEPLPTEPGSVELLAALVEGGARVLVPVTLPDRDLDWVDWTPTGRAQPLGTDAIGRADAVLVPALAVAADGTRLGRGGGSYDRALPRVSAGAVRAALLFDGEFVPLLPRDSWDRPVSAAVSPSGWIDLGVAGRD